MTSAVEKWGDAPTVVVGQKIGEAESWTARGANTVVRGIQQIL
jgi:hypothetical protein